MSNVSLPALITFQRFITLVVVSQFANNWLYWWFWTRRKVQ